MNSNNFLFVDGFVLCGLLDNSGHGGINTHMHTHVSCCKTIRNFVEIKKAFSRSPCTKCIKLTLKEQPLQFVLVNHTIFFYPDS